ncbi:hypothetical protein BGAL_0966g00010 [Botrytis galanthina]|uniref:Uncharacterized protein n=1 Tax=Botrytis galanthina TaxID=278940 RepID=A0A4S8QQN0_9HELO|nr:hypothetical protein BGAL_0966g00010 [Botrytis galanthina]
MSNITLQPVGLVDSSKHYWYQRIDTTSMDNFQSSDDLPWTFTQFVVAYGGEKYFYPGTDYEKLPLPEAATTLLGDYKTVTDQRLRIEVIPTNLPTLHACFNILLFDSSQLILSIHTKQEVYTSYGNLKDYFQSYANLALNYLSQLSAQIAADDTPNADDLQGLHSIVEERYNISSKMEQTASDLVTTLMEISSTLSSRIKSINQSVTDLDRECKLTASEVTIFVMGAEDRNSSATVRRCISALGYTQLASQVTGDTQAVCDEIGVMIEELQAEQGRWRNITSDLTDIEKYINSEQTTAVQIIANLDNEQIIERWQELGDIGTSNSTCIMKYS